MKILVVGGGGREHAIVKKLSESRYKPELFALPGNGGISQIATCFRDIKPTEIEKIVDKSKKYNFDLVFVASDEPLALGLIDALDAAGIRTFGPKKIAAEIEWSKIFSKNLMKKYEIPTAAYEVFGNFDEAVDYITGGIKFPVWIKSNGLAFGKGAMRAENKEKAYESLKLMMIDKVFGESGEKVIIEEELIGQEVSVLAFCDGFNIKPMVPSQDHKRAFDGDKGENTGGMGTFSPCKIYTPEIEAICMEKIFLPTVQALRNEGRTFKGVLYFGLILTKEGPKVIEYNSRFGDPEAQVVLPRLKTDFLEVIDAVIDGRLDLIKVEWHDNAAVCVIVASAGYPSKYKVGYTIDGIEDFGEKMGIELYHAGTDILNGSYKTSGGRVIGVTAIANTLPEAIKNVYRNVDKVNFQGMFYRRDIGQKGL